jgi:hypothetical protein
LIRDNSQRVQFLLKFRSPPAEIYVDADHLEGKAQNGSRSVEKGPNHAEDTEKSLIVNFKAGSFCSLLVDIAEFWYPDAPPGACAVIGYILLDIQEVGL